MTSTGTAGQQDVAAALDALAEKGGLLDRRTHGSDVRYGGPTPSGHRRALQRHIIEQHLSATGRDTIVRHHRAAVVTAGPPGAGKSHAIDRRFDGFRRIDADSVKDLLIDRALIDGDYQAQLSQTLPDGHPVMPREMSMLFHVEAWRIVDQIRAIALQRGENIVLEGTLAYAPYANRLLEQLQRSDYRDLTVVSIDVDEQTAHRQATDRWWSGRGDAIAGLDPRGARYVNVHRIAEGYWAADGTSICRGNARRMELAARRADMTTNLVKLPHR